MENHNGNDLGDQAGNKSPSSSQDKFPTPSKIRSLGLYAFGYRDLSSSAWTLSCVRLNWNFTS